MKVKLFVILLSILLGLNTILLGQETDSTSKTDYDYKYSIGVDNLPWDARGASIRWWKSQELNHYLSFSRTGATFAFYSDTLFIENSTAIIQYNRIHRKPFTDKSQKRFWVISGMGLGINFYFRDSKHGRKYESYYINSSISILYRMGIEHFPFEKIPNISYMVLVSGSAVVGFQQQSHIDEFGKYSINFGLGPGFHIWYHFN